MYLYALSIYIYIFIATAHQCPRITLSSLFAGDVLDYHNNSCYERVSTRRTWNEAERDCIRKGGHLLDIGSAQEETYIKQFLSRTDSQHAVWIGLHDQGHEETFTWTTGKTVNVRDLHSVTRDANGQC